MKERERRIHFQAHIRENRSIIVDGINGKFEEGIGIKLVVEEVAERHVIWRIGLGGGELGEIPNGTSTLKIARLRI